MLHRGALRTVDLEALGGLTAGDVLGATVSDRNDARAGGEGEEKGGDDLHLNTIEGGGWSFGMRN